MLITMRQIMPQKESLKNLILILKEFIKITFFMMETILLGELTKVNPFDQPSVELIKIETNKILKN